MSCPRDCCGMTVGKARVVGPRGVSDQGLHSDAGVRGSALIGFLGTLLRPEERPS